MNNDYGERRCPVCKTLFEAAYPGQVCCSDTCKKTRRLVLRREKDALYRLRRKGELEALRARVAELEAEVSRLRDMGTVSEKLTAEVERLHDELIGARLELVSRQAELDAAREELEALRGTREKITVKPASQAPHVDTSNWDYCKRMELRAPHLPCGEREECKGCERIRPLVLEPGDKVCAKCKQVFTPKAPAQKYCSKSCQEDAARAKIYGRKK